MRNLKRVLALALALVMTLGLMITASAASYADADQIDANYNEAIEVLTNMGVFRGQANGGESTEFAPKDILTRAEAATLVYRLLTADVTDAKTSNYDYTSFDDVKEGEWWTGYITYAANGKYVVGYGNGKFGPNDQVTGIEVLTIMLRALGYGQNGEFVGGGWKDHVVTTANENGMLKGVATNDLDKGASRELVAQLLFNAITAPSMVSYSPLKGYEKTGKTLGEDRFNLVSFEGVVTANEYADLTDIEPLAEGKTMIDGVIYNTATTLDDIGETRRGWATGKDVLYFVDPETDTIFETGDAVKKLDNKTANMKLDDAEYFINFDNGTTYKASDYRISYEINLGVTDKNGNQIYENLIAPCKVANCTKNHSAIEHANDGDLDTSNVYTKTIGIGKEITTQDLDLIYDIFDSADKVRFEYKLGEVYVGTQSNRDISDTLSYKEFVAKYIDTNDNPLIVTNNLAGNRLKIVDNDGDGYADYVLQTIYTVSQVEKVDKKGTITLAAEDEKLTDGDAVNTLTSKNKVVSADELAAGDVVLYAVIDGNAQTYLADVVTAKIDKVNRNTLVATTTDGDEYLESGVHNHTFNDAIWNGVVGLVGNTSYDLYFDLFGNLAAYTETTSNGSFVLLTDGWFASWKDSNEYSVKAYIDGELQTVDVTSGGKLFVDDDTSNDWGQLKTFGEINYTGYDYTDRNDKVHHTDDIHTIVASLDGNTLTPVDKVYYYRQNVVMVDMGTTIPLRTATEGTIYSSTSRNAYVTAGTAGDADVRALSTTTYYYVYNTTRSTVVREYVGYANIPSIDDTQIEDVYAVATRAVDAKADDYYTASVVVVELKDGYQEFDAEEVFVVDMPVVSGNVTKEEVEVIRANGDKETVTIDLTKSDLYRSYDPALGKRVAPGLCYMWESDVKGVYVIRYMTNAEIAASNYLIGTVSKDTATGATDWDSVDTWALFETYALDPNGGNKWIADFDEDEVAKKNVDSTQYYTLGYTTKTDSKNHVTYYVANLNDDVTRSEALAQNKDTKVKGAEDILNEVLVAYNNKGEIIYAISFNEYEDQKNLTTDIAQYVWESMLRLVPLEEGTPLPGKTAGEPSYTFYGLSKDSVTHTEAKDFKGEEIIEVTPAGDKSTIKLVTISPEAYTLTNDKQEFVVTVVVESEDGETTQVYTKTLTKEKAVEDSGLAAVTGMDGYVDGTKIGVKGNENVSVTALMKMFEATGKNATLEWSFTEKGTNTVVSGDDVDDNTTIDNYKNINVKVTAETGNSVTYTLETLWTVTETVDGKIEETAFIFDGEKYTPVTDSLNAGERTINADTDIKLWTVTLKCGNDNKTWTVTPATVVVEESTSALTAQNVIITRTSGNFQYNYYTSNTTDNTAVTVGTAATTKSSTATFDLSFTNVTAAATVTITLASGTDTAP